MEAAELSLDSPNIPDMKGGKPTAINAMASSPISAYSPSPSLSSGPAFSDEELAHLSVRQLNQRLQGQDRTTVTAIKQKRRTLKNRGYAFNCRVRRIQSQLQLEADNVMLREQVRYLSQSLNELRARLEYYEQPQSATAFAVSQPSVDSAQSSAMSLTYRTMPLENPTDNTLSHSSSEIPSPHITSHYASDSYMDPSENVTQTHCPPPPCAFYFSGNFS
jgi:hypothetical protein